MVRRSSKKKIEFDTPNGICVALRSARYAWIYTTNINKKHRRELRAMSEKDGSTLLVTLQTTNLHHILRLQDPALMPSPTPRPFVLFKHP